MSFSGNVRAEIAGIIPSGKKARETAAAVLLLNLGTLSGKENGELELELSSGNKIALRKCFTLIQKTVNIRPDLPQDGEPATMKFCDGALFDLLKRMRVVDSDGSVIKHDWTLPEEFVQGVRGRAYLREMFLCSGFMSDPETRYHLEFRCFSEPQAGQLLEVLDENGIHAGSIRRKSYQVVYVKDSENIAALLQLMGASVSLMATENARILKDVRNKVNRRVNCEAANIGKTVVSAGRQLEDIRFLREKGLLKTLPAQLQEAAALREEYPGASLSELGELTDPPVGRSGMNHRFRKLSVLSQKARDCSEEQDAGRESPSQR